MKIEDLADELGLKESYLKSHWALIQQRYKYNLNIELVKIGRGEKADYGIKSYGDKEIRWHKKERI